MKILKKWLSGILAGAMAFGAVGIPSVEKETAVVKAAGIVNILDYDKNTSASEYAIYDVAGMEYLAELVNNRWVPFDGKKVILKSDLQYNKSIKNNHTPIGTSAQSFSGSFDGENHVISGLNIEYDVSGAKDDEYVGVGVFGFLRYRNSDMTISSVSIKDSSIVGVKAVEGRTWGDGTPLETNSYASIGGIVGMCKGSVVIKDCGILDNVTIDGTDGFNQAGGVVGKVSGTGAEDVIRIERCKNKGRVKAKGFVAGILGNGVARRCEISCCVNYGNISGFRSVGGISGGSSGGKISECCNYGLIDDSIKQQNGSVGIGGIAGDCIDSISNSYNSGEVKGTESYVCIGGIYGYSSNIDATRLIFNSYSVGKITHKSKKASAVYCGNLPDTDSSLKNIYWLTGSADCDVDASSSWHKGKTVKDVSEISQYSQEKMKSQSFLDELNDNSVADGYGEVWAADTEGINSGYPILKNVPYDGTSASDDDVEPYIDPAEPAETGEVVSKLFKDYVYQTPVKEDSIRLYANGGTVSMGGVKTNYKTYTLYTKILPSYVYSLDSKGKLKKANGKVVVGITSSKTKPTLVKGKIVDASAAKIAKASISNGQITVTAQSLPGTVYLWVMDTGDLSRSTDSTEARGTYACCPVTVRSAPSALYTYAIPDFAYGTTKKYTSKSLSVGSSTTVYVYPTYQDGKVVKKAADGTYTATVASNVKDYFTVKRTDKEKFVIKAIGLRKGKSVTGKVTITCNQNGKKVVFTVTAKK